MAWNSSPVRHRTYASSTGYVFNPLELLTSWEFLYAVDSPSIFQGVPVVSMYSFGLGDQWLMQAKLRIARYTTTMVEKKATIDERLALIGISYLFGGGK